MALAMSRSLCALAALVLAVTSSAQDRPSGTRSTRSEAVGRNGMAATSQPLATQAALEILRRGGNAVDAAIAANAVLALTEPTGCGLGGDLFAIVWSAEEARLFGLNASGRSPAGLERDEAGAGVHRADGVQDGGHAVGLRR